MSEEQLIPTPGVFGETGNFLLERELGAGGMGGVYMGRDKMLDRPVAVKVMQRQYGSDAEFVEKFKKEAQAAARLIHPNIAQIYSYGIADGMPYIAMELVAGGSLDQLMKNCGATIDITRVMKICEQVAQALRCAADQGLVHGDVKPENVLLDANGNAKLVDFGLAAMQKDTNEIWGTPYYIAPEKVKKEQIDYRADMYSLGGTLYHALTGVAPFEGDDASAVVRKRFEGAPVPPSRLRAGITPQIDALVLKMLALNPADRHPTFEALLEDYRRVMASGLSATGDQSAAAAGTGSRKLVMKGRKRFKVKTAGDEEAGEEPSSGEQPLVSGKSSMRRMTQLPPPPEEQEGGVGGKVALVIGITIAVVGLVVGGLVWYTVADKKARAAEKQAQITSNIEKARVTISAIREKAVKFAQEFDDFAAKAIQECQKPTDDLKKTLSAEFDADMVSRIKPPPTAELLQAIALTNAVAQASVQADAGNEAGAAAAKAEAAKAAATPAAKIQTSSGKVIQFRDPTDDEADPMSPEHETYLKAKAQWEKEQKAKAEREAEERRAAAAAPAAEAKPAATQNLAVGALGEILDIAVRDMSDLWDRAYGCQAAAIRLHHRISQLVEKIDAFNIGGNDEAAMTNAARFSNEVSDEFEMIKASDEVSKVQKGIAYIKSKGKKTVEQTVNRLIIKANEEKRKAEEERRREEEEERLRRLAEEKAKTIEEDNAKINSLFDGLATAGTFRQLNWKSAVSQLESTKAEFKYSESQIVADGVIRKVKMMALVHEVFVANCQGYKFTRSTLGGYTIKEIKPEHMIVLKPDGKTTKKVPLPTFYQKYHGNLNELIIKFIEKGKDSAKGKDGKRLNLQTWADAMLGAALTMQVICSDDVAAAGRAEQIAKDVVKAYPDDYKVAQEIFPNFQFEAPVE